MNREISSRDLVREASARLREAGSESPYLDATLLLAHVWEVTREQMYALLGDPVHPDDAETFETLVQRRLSGEPVAYLVGYKEFFGHRFIVNRHVLVPRPETELLVETALDMCPDRESRYIHDCCTGSGCVAIAIAAERGEASVSMSDINEQTLEVAARNSLGVLGRVLPNWTSDLLNNVPGRFNIITCNPPYLSEDEMAFLHAAAEGDAASGRSPRHEPYAALSGGADGLEFVRFQEFTERFIRRRMHVI